MASAVLGTVLMVGIVFSVFGSLVAFAATNHYAKESCINEGAFRSIYDNTECPSEMSQNGNMSASEEDQYRRTWCDELLYEGSNIWSCPQVTIQDPTL